MADRMGAKAADPGRVLWTGAGQRRSAEPARGILAKETSAREARMMRVSRWCQATSRHIPWNCGPQKLLVHRAAQRPVAAAAPTPTSHSSFTQPQSAMGKSL